MLRIGIDLGGTKIELAALDGAGNLLFRRRAATRPASPEMIVDDIRQLVEGAERDLGEAALVGIGTPGSISPVTGCLRNSNTVCLNGYPLRQALEAALARSVNIANDANCFALSETMNGAARGAQTVFGVIIGTGVGGGLMVNGQMQIGANGIAGEWGHNPLPWPQPGELPGALCYCGKRGCIETFCSGPGLVRDYLAVVGDGAEGITAEVIAARAVLETPARDALLRYVDRLARALATVINLVDPEVIVLGGGLSQITDLYTELPKRIPDYLFSDICRTRILPPQHGDSSGVLGAAWLAGISA